MRTIARVLIPVLIPAAVAASAVLAADDPLKAFDTIHRVLLSPRCRNCHISGDAPFMLDDNSVHGQNVKRGADGRGAPGLPCSTCHGELNPPDSYGPHMPPGVSNWRLPPPSQKMVFVGLSKTELCNGLKDPKRNGGRSLDALLEHVDHDALVLWGWDPGAGRAPVPVPHEAFVGAMREWINGGAPCPAVP